MVAHNDGSISTDTSSALDIRVIGPDELDVYIQALVAGFSLPLRWRCISRRRSVRGAGTTSLRR
jgi:hypothetical protein